MTNRSVLYELNIQLDAGDWGISVPLDQTLIGPVQYGRDRFCQDPDSLTFGGGLLAGSPLPGTRRMVFCCPSPQWEGFYALQQYCFERHRSEYEDDWFRILAVGLGARHTKVSRKYRYVPEFETGGTFGVNMHTAADRLFSFNYRSIYAGDVERLDQHQRFVLDHYLKQFNRLLIRLPLPTMPGRRTWFQRPSGRKASTHWPSSGEQGASSDKPGTTCQTQVGQGVSG